MGETTHAQDAKKPDARRRRADQVPLIYQSPVISDQSSVISYQEALPFEVCSLEFDL